MKKKTFLGETNLAKVTTRMFSGWLSLETGENTTLKLGESVSFSPIEIVHAIGLKGRRDTNSLNATQ